MHLANPSVFIVICYVLLEQSQCDLTQLYFITLYWQISPNQKFEEISETNN